MVHPQLRKMMPHQIKVKKVLDTARDGSYTYETNFRTYACLFDDSTSISRSDGDYELVTVGRTAYIDTEGVAIGKNDKIEFTDGTTRPVVNISHHFDFDGSIDSVTVKFQ
jgi:hypothetical protein